LFKETWATSTTKKVWVTISALFLATTRFFWSQRVSARIYPKGENKVRLGCNAAKQALLSDYRLLSLLIFNQ